MLRIAHARCYHHPLPPKHRFPMEKYSLLPELLLREGTISPANLFEPSVLEEKWILRTHHPAYWEALHTQTLPASAARKIGFPMSPELLHRERVITQGTVDCARYALRYGAAINVAGGTHHAFADSGEGFCIFNDIAVAANYLLDNELAEKVLVVDLDVHQGNGTAKIFENEPRVFTFSMHGGRNYPFIKQRSDLDIELPDGCNDAHYLGLLESNLPALIARETPDFIFYQSGVDILATDKLGRLGVSPEGCKRRDALVFELCHSQEIPVVAVMGGGYSPNIHDILEAHANTYRLAQAIFF